MSNVPLLASLIASFVAMIGLFLTALFSTLSRRDARRKLDQEAVHTASMRLASDKAPERAVGLGMMIDYMANPLTAAASRRLTIESLHYESDSLITYRAAEGLSASESLVPAIQDLITINRELWLDTTHSFELLCVGDASSPLRDEEEQVSINLGMLKQNRKLLSLLVRKLPEAKELDFSETFLPGWFVPASRWLGCNFENSLLHYSDFRESNFTSCDMKKAVLIGSYFEGVTSIESRFEDALLHGIRVHDADTAAQIGYEGPSGVESFLWQVEYDWYGHWVGQKKKGGKIEFDAKWATKSAKSVTAQVAYDGDRSFLRTKSSDSNDGQYEITLDRELDSLRDVHLIGGRRLLRSGIPGSWYGIWWRQWEKRVTF